MLDAKTILATEDIKSVCMPVPEWGGDIYIKTMTSKRRDELEARFMSGGKSMAGLRAAIGVLCICNEDGELIFNSKQEAALSEKSGDVLARIADAAMKHNGFSDDDVEELAGN